MDHSFCKDIKYLLYGNDTQREVYQLLVDLQIFYHLHEFKPILVGTVPLGINIPGSDLDIICEVKDFDRFESLIIKCFKDYPDFSLVRKQVEGKERIKVNFQFGGWPIEIFGQNQPTIEQHGYQHMVIEDRLLKLFGERFKDTIIQWKLDGLKTEPAFAKALKLEGDPYIELLHLQDKDDEALRNIWVISIDGQ